MGFKSILFPGAAGETVDPAEETADFYGDLRLNEVFAAVVEGREDYDLVPFFRLPLRTADEVAYRHEVLRDLADEGLRGHVETFASAMRGVRTQLAQMGKLHYRYQRAIWFLGAVVDYCGSVRTLAGNLPHAAASSGGMVGFAAYLRSYTDSGTFTALASESRRLREGLRDVAYRVQIKGNRVAVGAYEPDADYSREIEQTFSRFRQGGVNDYSVVFPSFPEMNHVEAEVLERVAKLHPDLFASLVAFAYGRQAFLDETLVRFDREVQFYLAYLAFAGRLEAAGLSFCLPEVHSAGKAVAAERTFDLALAESLLKAGGHVVCNDFHLQGVERVFVVSGPNQGGKTTFARTFGQLHHLGRLGLPVPGRRARLLLCDRIFTVFARSEQLEDQRGRLQGELERLREILADATDRSILIMNETFSSTTLQDARLLGEAVLGRVIRKDMLCVYVTFVDELSTLGDETVSMVGTVDLEDPTMRTYEILRHPPDGLAYAMALARKHRLTYDMLQRRLAR